MPLALTAKSSCGSCGRPVVRGLGRGVDHQLDGVAVFLEETVDGRGVANIDWPVLIALAQFSLEAAAIPVGRSFVAEEDAAHVVVDADDCIALVGKKARGLRADQPG